MTLAAKLGLKDQGVELVGAPAGLSIEAKTADGPSSALLVFVQDRRALLRRLQRIVRSAAADRRTWVSYPKAGQLGTDLNRDTLSALLQEHGIRPVTQISIDATWSALRFRPMK